MNTRKFRPLRVVKTTPAKVDIVPVFGRPPTWIRGGEAERLFIELGRKFITPEKFLPIDSDAFATFCWFRAQATAYATQISANKKRQKLTPLERKMYERLHLEYLKRCRHYAQELLLERELMSPTE